MDSSAFMNMIPFDSKRHEISNYTGESFREQSPNKVFSIFNQKEHNYIREITLDQNQEHRIIQEGIS